ncbi:hypothetical protein QFC19_001171 [Naganishia cerealis]|uniref:Uncharacterized protein n=1 Tax=Naganishia cerealis TaxID=610337 RepID=A0ACC2WJZ8_9TREE|nr:hypothetical protein QFC19_001171 [Naganishia cerealis]
MSWNDKSKSDDATWESIIINAFGGSSDSAEVEDPQLQAEVKQAGCLGIKGALAEVSPSVAVREVNLVRDEAQEQARRQNADVLPSRFQLSPLHVEQIRIIGSTFLSVLQFAPAFDITERQIRQIVRRLDEHLSTNSGETGEVDTARELQSALVTSLTAQLSTRHVDEGIEPDMAESSRHGSKSLEEELAQTSTITINSEPAVLENENPTDRANGTNQTIIDSFPSSSQNLVTSSSSTSSLRGLRQLLTTSVATTFTRGSEIQNGVEQHLDNGILPAIGSSVLPKATIAIENHTENKGQPASSRNANQRFSQPFIRKELGSPSSDGHVASPQIAMQPLDTDRRRDELKQKLPSNTIGPVTPGLDRYLLTRPQRQTLSVILRETTPPSPLISLTLDSPGASGSAMPPISTTYRHSRLGTKANRKVTVGVNGQVISRASGSSHPAHNMARKRPSKLNASDFASGSHTQTVDAAPSHIQQAILEEPESLLNSTTDSAKTLPPDVPAQNISKVRDFPLSLPSEYDASTSVPPLPRWLKAQPQERHRGSRVPPLPEWAQGPEHTAPDVPYANKRRRVYAPEPEWCKTVTVRTKSNQLGLQGLMERDSNGTSTVVAGSSMQAIATVLPAPRESSIPDTLPPNAPNIPTVNGICKEQRDFISTSSSPRGATDSPDPISAEPQAADASSATPGSPVTATIIDREASVPPRSPVPAPRHIVLAHITLQRPRPIPGSQKSSAESSSSAVLSPSDQTQVDNGQPLSVKPNTVASRFNDQRSRMDEDEDPIALNPGTNRTRSHRRLILNPPGSRNNGVENREPQEYQQPEKIWLPFICRYGDCVFMQAANVAFANTQKLRGHFAAHHLDVNGNKGFPCCVVKDCPYNFSEAFNTIAQSHTHIRRHPPAVLADIQYAQDMRATAPTSILVPLPDKEVPTCLITCPPVRNGPKAPVQAMIQALAETQDLWDSQADMTFRTAFGFVPVSHSEPAMDGAPIPTYNMYAQGTPSDTRSVFNPVPEYTLCTPRHPASHRSWRRLPVKMELVPKRDHEKLVTPWCNLSELSRRDDAKSLLIMTRDPEQAIREQEKEGPRKVALEDPAEIREGMDREWPLRGTIGPGYYLDDIP